METYGGGDTIPQTARSRPGDSLRNPYRTYGAYTGMRH